MLRPVDLPFHGPYRRDTDIVTGLYSLLSDNLNICRSWGFHFFSPEFDNEPELRNRIGAIWITSLLDSLEGEIRLLASIRERAAERDLPHVLDACDEIELFLECIKEVLEKFSPREQVVLSDMRDQLVHSWLGRRHTPYLSIRYFDGESFVREKLLQEEHSQIIREQQIGTVDEALLPLIERFRDPLLRYWHVVKELIELGTGLDQVQDLLLAGQSFRIESLTNEIRGPVEWRF